MRRGAAFASAVAGAAGRKAVAVASVAKEVVIERALAALCEDQAANRIGLRQRACSGVGAHVSMDENHAVKKSNDHPEQRPSGVRFRCPGAKRETASRRAIDGWRA